MRALALKHLLEHLYARSAKLRKHTRASRDSGNKTWDVSACKKLKRWFLYMSGPAVLEEPCYISRDPIVDRFGMPIDKPERISVGVNDKSSLIFDVDLWWH